MRRGGGTVIGVRRENTRWLGIRVEETVVGVWLDGKYEYEGGVQEER